MRVEFNRTWFIIGKSAEDNWRIISEADKDYYWIHADGVPSSHIIIETDIPLKEEILFGCELCKSNTKKIKNSSVNFVATQIKNIKLGSKPGEVYFKQKSNMMFIENNNITIIKK